MLGTQAGWQLYWMLVGTVVLISAISVANLYVQGGMQLRHAAWFTLLLAAYDYYFSQIVPLTPELADRFQGYPLNAAVGFRFDVFNAAIGIGDLLAFAIFGAATYKAYGPKALRLTLACIVDLRRRRPQPHTTRPRSLHPRQPQHRRPRPNLVRTTSVPALPLDARPLRPGTHHGPVPRQRRCRCRPPRTRRSPTPRPAPASADDHEHHESDAFAPPQSRQAIAAHCSAALDRGTPVAPPRRRYPTRHLQHRDAPERQLRTPGDYRQPSRHIRHLGVAHIASCSRSRAGGTALRGCLLELVLARLRTRRVRSRPCRPRPLAPRPTVETPPGQQATTTATGGFRVAAI